MIAVFLPLLLGCDRGVGGPCGDAICADDEFCAMYPPGNGYGGKDAALPDDGAVEYVCQYLPGDCRSCDCACKENERTRCTTEGDSTFCEMTYL